MLLRNWEDLPEFMQNDKVKPYYNALKNKRGQLILKRVFDIVCSLVLIFILSPVILIFLSSGILQTANPLIQWNM